MFFKRGDRLEYIKTGSTFRCVHKDRTVETAEVISVYTDAYGIPHVRYSVSFERPYRERFQEGSRILALRSFFDHFSERVNA
jgi:hypothetical protein